MVTKTYYNYGKEVLGWLSDNQTLPANATPVKSTNMVNIVGRTNGALWINVYAQTAFEIVTTATFSIELKGFTSDVVASAIEPFSKDNKAGEIATGGGTSQPEAHYYLLHRTAGDAELTFSAGDLITQCAIPEDMFNALGYDYACLYYTSSADESADLVTAFVYAKL